MTLPLDTQLPLNIDYLKSGDAEKLTEYMRELIRKLEENYRDIVQNVNGDTRSFTPVLKDTSSSTTYIYTRQIGWYLRKGLMVDYWFDVIWTGLMGGPTGNLYLELPYEVFDTQGTPFVGAIQSSTLTYGAGQTTLTINAIPGTFRGEIYGSGSGISMANITANTSSGQLIGHIRYVGNEYE